MISVERRLAPLMSHIRTERLRRRGVVVGDGALFRGAPVVEAVPGSLIRIGYRFEGISAARWPGLGVNHPVVIRTVLPGAEVLIGNDVGMTGGTICAATRVVIGDGVLIGANAIIVDSDFHDLASPHRRHARIPKPGSADAVVIGDNVFIGTNSIVLKGVRIGNNSVIGAGSVVTSSIPDGCIAAGSPSAIVRRI